MRAEYGRFTAETAARTYGQWLAGCTPDTYRELSYFDQKQLHQFKYFTWVEQQGKTSDELRELWDPDFWTELFDESQVKQWDKLITQFNAATGLLK